MVVLPPTAPSSLPTMRTPPAGLLEKTLSIVSVVTMLFTIPQVFKVWTGPGATGVSLVSWVSYLVAATLWFIHGLRKRDRSIYLACIGWIILDLAVVIGIVVRP
ncbi:MAG: hypothetical protein ABI592_06775 [Acidobacteriota bacterium]